MPISLLKRLTNWKAQATVEPVINQEPAVTSDQGTRANISGASAIDGFIGACLVDSDSGFMLASEGGSNLDLEAASALNTQVIKAKLAAVEMLNLNDTIEDILVTMGQQYHLIRPLEKSPTMFMFLALEKQAANLGLARLHLRKIEAGLSL